MREQGPETGDQGAGGARILLQFVAAAIACAVSAGLTVITATVLAVAALRGDGSSPNLDQSFYLLAGGTLLGVLLAASAAWRLLAPVESLYRRGGLSIVCAFGTILLMLICIPVHQILGTAGLLGLLGLSGAAALIFWRQTDRIGAGA
jgi:hypothetical protein